MKKLFAVLLAALLVLPMAAQVSRVGDKYYVDGKVMKPMDFATYMQTNAEANLANQFSNGKIVADVGWGLFAGGLGTITAGVITISALSNPDNNKKNMGEALGDVVGGSVMATFILSAGVVVTSGGIVCLGTGYGLMHKSADTYIATTRQQPQAYWSVQLDQNGLGLALNF